jgi:hypothetical protein
LLITDSQIQPACSRDWRNGGGHIDLGESIHSEGRRCREYHVAFVSLIEKAAR